MRVEIQGPGPTKDQILQISQGGTSAITNEQALHNLGAIAPEQINVPGGVVGYGFGTKKIDQSLIPALPGGTNTVTIQGPQTIILGGSVILKITNFDSFTDYFVTFKKFTGIIEGDTILLTATEVGAGEVIVNGSIFPISITFSSPSLTGDTVFKKETQSSTTNIVSNSDLTYLLVARKTKDFKGSVNAGEVELYKRIGETELESVYKINPESFNTTINYSGEGVKKFTANNNVTEVSNSGSLIFSGAGNILLQATGSTVVSGGTAQQGNPSYPNGLPVYIAPEKPGTPEQGNANYPQGLPPYVPSTYVPAQGDPSYPSGLPPYKPTANIPQQGDSNYPSGLPAYSAGVNVPEQGNPNYPNGLPVYAPATSGVQQGLPEYPDGLPAYKASVVTPQQGNAAYPTGLPVYKAATSGVQQGLLAYPNGLPVYKAAVNTPAQGVPSYPNGLPAYKAGVNTPQQGNPSYPSGLPAYVAVITSPQQGLPAYPDGLPPYVAAGGAQQGLSWFPNGLPAYVGYVPEIHRGEVGYSYTASSGINIWISGNSDNLVNWNLQASVDNGTVNITSVSVFNRTSLMVGADWVKLAGAGDNGAYGNFYTIVDFTTNTPRAGIPSTGDPSYPNGLPPYVAGSTSPQQGNPSYPSGLPVYIPANTECVITQSLSTNRPSTAPFGLNFTLASSDAKNWTVRNLTVINPGNWITTVVFTKIDKYRNKYVMVSYTRTTTGHPTAALNGTFSEVLTTDSPYTLVTRQAIGNPSYPNGLPPYKAAVNTPAQGNSSYPDGLPPYKAAVNTPQQGLSSYPNGLPAYQASSSSPQQGLPAYPNGLPVYVAAVNTPAQGNVSYPNGLPAYQVSGSSPQQGQPSYPNGLPPYRAAIYLPKEGMPSYPNGLPPYVAAGTTPQQGLPLYPDGLVPYIPSSGGPQQGNSNFPNGLPIYLAPTQPGNPGQGNALYPQGLLPFVASTPAQTYTDTVIFESNRFYVSGTTVNQTVYPYKNNFIGQALTLSEQGTFAYGTSLETVDRLKQGGEVIIVHNDNEVITTQSIAVPFITPHPRFGASVCLRADASYLLIGSPGASKVSLYKNSNRLFGNPSEIQPSGVQPTARFGEIVEANQDFTKVYIYAPGEGSQGVIYLYSLSGNTLALQEKIIISGLPQNARLHNKICTVSNNNYLYFNTYDLVSKKYSVVELQAQSGSWAISKTFTSPTPQIPDLFGQSFDISLNRAVMVIGSAGDVNMKGIVNIWIYENNEWVFYDSVIEDHAEFGDRFGHAVVVSGGGNNALTISHKATGDSLVYLK